jgi:hypothetical protein
VIRTKRERERERERERGKESQERIFTSSSLEANRMRNLTTRTIPEIVSAVNTNVAAQ